MSNEHSDQDLLAEEANRLYWESDESVNQIGEQLELSKGMLYALLRPLPAGLPCPECGEEMVFPNRTARDRGFLECPECGMEEEESAVEAYWEGRAERGAPEDEDLPAPLTQRAGEALQRAVRGGRQRVQALSPRGRVLAGTALLGVAAGIVLGAYFRKR